VVFSIKVVLFDSTIVATPRLIKILEKCLLRLIIIYSISQLSHYVDIFTNSNNLD